MRTIDHGPPLATIEIVRIPDSGAEENFQPGLFGQFAKLAYPRQTEAILAALGRVSTRAARAWMSGTAAAPWFVAVCCFWEIARRCRWK